MIGHVIQFLSLISKVSSLFLFISLLCTGFAYSDNTNNAFTSNSILSLLDPLGVLVNTGVSLSFPADNQSACTDLCTGSSKISAVSYSAAYKQCITSSCALLRTIPNALWKTFSCIPQINAVCYIQPKFEWMLTDSCGNANTGWYKPGLLIRPMYNFTSYNVSYNRAVTPQLGNAMTFPGLANYFGMSEPSEFTFDYKKSFTLFAAFNVSTPYTTSMFPMIEFGTYSTSGAYSTGAHFWQYPAGNGTFFNFEFFGAGCKQGGTNAYGVNTVNYAALVYKYVGSNVANISMYFNGNQFLTRSCTVQNSLSYNVLAIASRPGSNSGNLNGAVYCIKIYDYTLSPSQIQDLSTTCTTARSTF